MEASVTSTPSTRAAHRRWYAKNGEKRATYGREWRKKNPGYNKAWYAKNPEKLRAKWKVHAAVRSGKLIRQACQCGNPNSEAHHEDYSKPLEVKWLCRRCHRAEHRVDQ